MATYTELRSILGDRSLLNRITVAVGVSAEAIRTESAATPNHANRLLWAKDVFVNPTQRAAEMQWAVIIANRTASTAQILAAADTAIQTNVDANVDVFATGA